MAQARGAGEPRRHGGSTLAVAVLVLAAVQGECVAERVLVEGDMWVERDGREGEALATSPLVRRSQLFPQGRVHYFIDTEVTETPLRGPLFTNDTRIAEAIVEWESKTCIRFTMCTEEATCTKPYMRFISGPQCSSYVGAASNGVTKVTLSGCGRGSTIHELGHALGLLHEQSRKDRDENVVVDYAHIKPEAGRNMAKMAGTGRDIGPYDYGSIMHYPARAFSSDGEYTIIAPVKIGQRRALSPWDAAAINFMYGGCVARLPRPLCMGSVLTNATHVIPHSRSWDMDFNAVYSPPETMSVSYGAMTAPGGRVTTSVAAGASIGDMGFTTLRFTPTVADAGKTYVLSATFTGSDGAAATCSVSVHVARSEAVCFGIGGDDARVCSGHGVCVGGLQSPCVCDLGYGGVDCSAQAGCVANQATDFDDGDVGAWSTGDVDTSFHAEGGGSMRVGVPGNGRQYSASLGMAAIAPTKVTFYMAGLAGSQRMRLFSGRTECTNVMRNAQGVFQVQNKELADEGVLQARRFYFVEMRLDWAGRKVSVLLDGKLVAEGVKMHRECFAGMNLVTFDGNGGWVDEFQAWCTHFVAMAGPLADGVTAAQLRGATESHLQQQALVLTVAGATDTWVNTRANKRRVIEALVADLPSPQGWNAHREALLPLAQADTLVTIEGHVLTVGPLRVAPALAPTVDETVSVRLTGSMFRSGHLPDTAGAALRFQLAGACPQSKTWGFESSTDIPVDLVSRAAITTRTVHEGRGALQFTSAYAFGTFQPVGAAVQPAAVSMAVRLADTRYGRLSVSLVDESSNSVNLQYGYLHRLGFRTTDTAAPSSYLYEYVAPVVADRFQVISVVFDWKAHTFSISLDGAAVLASAPLPEKFSSVSKVTTYSSRVPAYMDSLSLQCADPLPLFAIEGCGAAARMAVHPGTDGHGLGAQDRVAVVPASAGGCAAAEAQCAVLSACSWETGSLSSELGRVHWVMGSQARLQAGEQYRVCYFRKSTGRYDMLGETFTGCGAGAPPPAPSTTVPETLAPNTDAPATGSPATPAPETDAPATPSPATPAPVTPAPRTPAPSTDAPDTVSPATPAPATSAPPTSAPQTPAPETDAPATFAPATPAPRTPAPSTDAPATASPATPSPATPAPRTPAPSTDAPATGSPATPAPETDAPATPSPATPAPVTSAPRTLAPSTDAPDTVSPATPAPATSAPPTSAPQTPAPETDAPATLAPATPAPRTPAPITDAPATASPATPAPETDAPATPSPATPAPATRAPRTPSPATPAPVTSAPRTPAPSTDAPDTVSPATSAPETSAPPTSAPQTPAPETDAPATLAPATPAPRTPAPSTDAPATASPATPSPATPAPATRAPRTPSPATPAPVTSAPRTPAPSTDAPDTVSPATPAPETSAPPTSAPQTPAPETDAPATLAPATPAPRTPAPSTDAPATASPATPSPATPAPVTPAPRTPAPSTYAPATSASPTSAPRTLAPKTDAPATPSPATHAPPTVAPRTAAPRTGAPACSGKGCRRPNIVAFVPRQVDFVWDEAPLAVSGMPPMPHMDRVRAEGAVFQRAYSSAGDSVPSRFSFLTGRHASRSWTLRRGAARKVAQWNGRVRVSGRGIRLTGVDAADNLQAALARSGYETIHSGDWGLHGTGGLRKNYKLLQQSIRKTGFTQVASAYLPLGRKGGLNPATGERWSHNPEWLVNTSLAAVGAAVSAGKPFFLHMAPTGPRLPATKAALDFDARVTPAGLLEAAPQTTMRPRAELWAAAVAAVEASGLPPSRADKFAGHMWVDDALGAVLDGLDALGVLDETLVLVASDISTVGRALQEGRTRVMQAVRFPAEVVPGTQVSSVVTHTDTAATLLDLAGARDAATGGLDGASWRAEAAGAGAPPTTVPKVMEHKLVRAVVAGRWKYIDYGATSRAKPGLFDLATDPAGRTNLAGLAQHADTVAVMASYLACHDADTGLAPGAQGCAAPLIANEFSQSS